MTETLFIWSRDKARHNLSKRNVSFEQARAIFSDPGMLMQKDVRDSGEQRMQAIVFADATLPLTVVFVDC